jgi:hypothetical protein
MEQAHCDGPTATAGVHPAFDITPATLYMSFMPSKGKKVLPLSGELVPESGRRRLFGNFGGEVPQNLLWEVHTGAI